MELDNTLCTLSQSQSPKHPDHVAFITLRTHMGLEKHDAIRATSTSAISHGSGLATMEIAMLATDDSAPK